MGNRRVAVRAGCRVPLSIATVCVVALGAGCGGPSTPPRTATATPPAVATATPTVQAAAYAPPWRRTEQREPCANFAPLRQPFFGDLHVHTKFSADATIYGTKVGPREAYDFARGGTIAVSDDDEAPTRQARIDRPLDFAAVTDHAEWYGEVNVCTTPGSAVYDANICKILRQPDPPSMQFIVTVQWLFPAGIPNPPPSLPFCTLPGVDCDAAAVSVWQEIQAAAEAAYDRSAACTFTSFIGYEHTASPVGRHLHRNVIFRNEHVPPFAASQLDTAAGGIPYGLWTAIENGCLNAESGCDAVVIPHNSNLSEGMQFFDPADAADARRRQDREPLIEIYQQKGNSECRFDRLAGRGVGTADELCTFEQLLHAHEGPGVPPPPIDEYPARNLVRNALKDGLAFENVLGVNPFAFGFIGDTDTHNATAGNVEEGGWVGSQGNSDSSPERKIGDSIRNNPGGLAVVWAEENSRDAIFAALRRRETYATSGTRPVVRFFGGSLDDVHCGSADFVANAYRTGTAMGGELGPVRGSASPRFAVLAARDPGTDESPGTALQRVQIVKGWVDADNVTHEAVYDVAGEVNDASVDPDTCEPVGAGHDELCAVWEDPSFDPSQRAFYYARLLENPTCRWSTRVCKAAGVDPFAPDCAAQAAAADPAFANCCLGESDDPFLSPVIQERAWTSPIWYKPDGIAVLNGAIGVAPAYVGNTPVSAVLYIELGAQPPGVDFERDGLTVTLGGDAEFFRAVIFAGAFIKSGPEASAVLVGYDNSALASVRVLFLPTGEVGIEVEALSNPFPPVEPTSRPVDVRVMSGTFQAASLRTWISDGHYLVPKGSARQLGE